MRKLTISLLAVVGGAVLTIGPEMSIPYVHAADKPPATKESKPSGTTGTMSGTEQKGSNVDRNANTKTTPPPKK